MSVRQRKSWAAYANYRRFHGRPPARISRLVLPDFKAVTLLGEAKAIEYVSAKKIHAGDTSRERGRKRLFRHEMGKGVKIYLHPNRRIIFVMGGKFRVTDWMRD